MSHIVHKTTEVQRGALIGGDIDRVLCFDEKHRTVSLADLMPDLVQVYRDDVTFQSYRDLQNYRLKITVEAEPIRDREDEQHYEAGGES